jgi:hypothetical protein
MANNANTRPKIMTIYKIRHRVTGKFSSGGYRPVWKDKGKSWLTRGPLSSHFTGLSQTSRNFYDENAEVVVYELVVKETSPTLDWIAASRQRAAKREAERQRHYLNTQLQNKQAELERTRAQLARLEKELGVKK